MLDAAIDANDADANDADANEANEVEVDESEVAAREVDASEVGANEMIANGMPLEDQTLADVAADKDKLFYEGYVKGIAEFISECSTPMTIGIQGEWGVGKSSLFKLIEKELRGAANSEDGDDSDEEYIGYREDIIDVAIIDVWKQSVANPTTEVFEVFVRELISKLSGGAVEAMKRVSDFASSASQVMNAMTSVTAVSGDGGEEGEAGAEAEEEEGANSITAVLQWLFGSEDDSKTEELGDEFTTDEAIERFKADLVNVLAQNADNNGKSKESRLVIIIDGVEELEPVDIVDLLEKIKVYFECPRLVFVLAVDERAVLDGVWNKLGDKVDEGRRKMFFEKHVQVPLYIPTSAYNLDKYIKELLEKDEEKELSGEFVKIIDAMLHNYTPRSIKRYVSTMYQYQNVLEKPETEGDESLPMLFAATILKVESEEGLDAIADCAQCDEAHFDEALKAKLDSSDFGGRINWSNLAALWRTGGTADEHADEPAAKHAAKHDGGHADEDAAKKSAFISWIKKLK